MKSTGVFASLTIALLGLAPCAYGQPYPYPYPIYQSGFGPGAVLQGRAQVIDAQGNLMLQQEQARIEREKANQAKLDTKRKTLDWENYEREHTFTDVEKQARIQGLQIMQMLKTANDPLVLSGKAMNILLPYLTQVAEQGVHGPPVSLDPEQLKMINVTGKGSGANLGVLSAGKMDWPLALRGPQQQEVDKAISKAVSDTLAGTLTFQEYNAAAKGVAKLRQDAQTAWNAEQIDTAAYIESKRFLESLSNGLEVLKRPDAAKYLGGGFKATGNTVAELVVNMSRQGLSFAPALPGEEAAYYGVLNSMVAFAGAGESSGGFRVRLTPPILKASSSQ
jgi:hypothetical protein